jgi:Mn2+/Fe2+ NRAMP family transporter
MGDDTIGGWLYAAGWVVTLVITILSVIFLIQQFA